MSSGRFLLLAVVGIAPLRALAAQPDTAAVASLVRALIMPVAAELAMGHPAASGYTYRYRFTRVAGEWRYVNAAPDIAYDPPPPRVVRDTSSPCAA